MIQKVHKLLNKQDIAELREICYGELQNLANWSMEFRKIWSGKLLSLLIIIWCSDWRVTAVVTVLLFCPPGTNFACYFRNCCTSTNSKYARRKKNVSIYFLHWFLHPILFLKYSSFTRCYKTTSARPV